MNEAYRDLLTLAARVPADGGAAQQALDEASAEHIRELLRDGGEPAEIAAYLGADMDALAAAPGADPQAVTRLRAALTARFTVQAQKNAVRRRILAGIPLALLGLVLVVYVTLKFVYMIGIHDPVDTRQGMIQRAQATQKIVYYENWNLDEIPSGRGYLFFSIYLWPVEPTGGEVEGAKEFITLALELNRELSTAENCALAGSDDWLVGAPSRVNQVGFERFVDRISQRLLSKEMKWSGTPRDSLRNAVRSVQCYPYAPMRDGAVPQ